MFKMAVSFSNSWYDVTPGLALAEQLKPTTFSVHALTGHSQVCLRTKDTIYKYNFIGLSKLYFTK